MKVKDEDRKFVEKSFPGLRFISKDEKLFLKGSLDFIARFIKKEKSYVLHKASSVIPDKNIISDSYEIRINLSNDVNPYREVEELGGKIKRVAKEKGKLLVDLHAYEDGKVCVWGYLDENEKISLKDFLGSVIVPFFYDQSWYAKYEEWPRGFFSHSFLGLFENYKMKLNSIQGNDALTSELTAKCMDSIAEMAKLSEVHQAHWEKIINFIESGKIFRKKKGNKKGQCLCGSHKYFPVCHPEAFNGFMLLKENLKKFNINYQ